MERTQSTLFGPKLMSGVFSQFRFESTKLLRNPTRGPFCPVVERKKLQLIFFESNAPNPHHLTQNSFLVCFRSFGFGHQNSCETRPRPEGRSGNLRSEKISVDFFESNAPTPFYP